MGFEPWTPGRKANTIITKLKRILSNAVVRPFLKEWSPLTVNVTQNINFVFYRVKDIPGNGENSGCPQCFLKRFYSRTSKVTIMWERFKHIFHNKSCTSLFLYFCVQ